jgi:hypothetical protein
VAALLVILLTLRAIPVRIPLEPFELPSGFSLALLRPCCIVQGVAHPRILDGLRPRATGKHQ